MSFFRRRHHIKLVARPVHHFAFAGQVIEHERFGIGDVIKIEGTGENSKATVRFRNAGEKQLLLKFARFKVVG